MAAQRVIGTQQNRPIPDRFVEIAHDGIEGTARVAPRALPHWEARGWFEVTDTSPAPAPPAPPAPAPGEDPVGDSIEEGRRIAEQQLAQVDAAPAEKTTPAPTGEQAPPAAPAGQNKSSATRRGASTGQES